MKNNKGITLIALIITIIVLLILAVVTITMVTDGGIFSHAKDATQKYSEAADKEQKVVGAVKSNGNYYSSIDDYFNNKLAAGLYDANGDLLADWETLVKPVADGGYGLDITKNYPIRTQETVNRKG